jgi:hypothetical protein
MFWRTYKNSYVSLYGYDDILLRLYIDIAKTGDFTKLVKVGKVSNEKCLEQWEKIVKKQEEETGASEYTAFITLSKGYLLHLNNHTTIRATLILVGLTRFFIDWDYIVDLNKKGYIIDTTSPETILKSVTEGLHVCEGLITKAESKRKEIEKLIKHKQATNEGTFDQALAHLNFSLKFNVDENITLARYNEYQKILKARQKAEEEAKEQADGRNK